MKTEQLVDFFEGKDFIVNLYKSNNEQCAEIETWTKGGVNMILCLEPFSIECFKECVNDFDMDEEIDLHRQMKGYKDAFSIRESVSDFEDYEKRLRRVLWDLISFA